MEKNYIKTLEKKILKRIFWLLSFPDFFGTQFFPPFTPSPPTFSPPLPLPRTIAECGVIEHVFLQPEMARTKSGTCSIQVIEDIQSSVSRSLVIFNCPRVVWFSEHSLLPSVSIPSLVYISMEGMEGGGGRRVQDIQGGGEGKLVLPQIQITVIFSYSSLGGGKEMYIAIDGETLLSISPGWILVCGGVGGGEGNERWNWRRGLPDMP